MKEEYGMNAMQKYSTILVDPPWQYGAWGKPSNRLFKRFNESFPMPYPTMTLVEICRLPVRQVAAENCELYLWTTQRYLPSAFRVLDDWGFKYCQILTWCKEPRGLGQGGVYCPTTEFLLLARVGKMPKVRRLDSTWFKVKRTNIHSSKPEFFQEMIERVTRPPRLELFARRKRPGWDCWGNEVESDIDFWNDHAEL
jgi:N6-adenosine-specific RNA methylase IME4